jgi:hypothetical protein
MVRFLVYSNEYDIEGLIATTSVWLREKTREDLIRRQIDAYEKVRPNLTKHADGYPTADELRKVTTTGQTGFGMDAVGFGKSTAGAQRIIESVDQHDDRPIWVTGWGGPNTLAQALWDVKYSRTPEELAKFVSKIRVYTISDQDNSGRWMRITFPDLYYVVSPSRSDWWTEYYKSTWSGIAGDRHYENSPYHFFELVDNPWLEKNIIKDHGPLGELYPPLEYIMEGDTPSFLNLINNGLGSHLSPAYGGWGGRYALDKTYAEVRPIWTNSRDRVQAQDGSWHTTAQATIWRWREAYQYDFAARMDWCVEKFEDANHNPVAILNGDDSKDVLEISAKAGDKIELSAKGSNDPDGDSFDITWFHYKEAGTLTETVELSSAKGTSTTFTAPTVQEKSTIHIILQLRDNGTPNLFSYRRAIITVEP